ncbi:hypothetical protein ASZ90_018015 [hydrocarbon metagenome]|uniref:Uncharacterized protein n=1 Tax=hydrocarbon metagenome TaxID=938273 RepID=A0A0W8E7E6_9ZZZZ
MQETNEPGPEVYDMLPLLVVGFDYLTCLPWREHINTPGPHIL